MTATAPTSSESVSTFALLWLTVAASVALVVFLLITFKLPVLAFAKSIWPYFDLI